MYRGKNRHQVELERLDKIATSRLRNSNPCDKDVQTRAVNVIATYNIQSTRNRLLGKLLCLNHLKKEETIHVDRMINKYSDLYYIPDEPLGHTHVTAHKIVTTDDRSINIKR